RFAEHPGRGPLPPAQAGGEPLKLHWRPSPRAEGRGAVGRKAAGPVIVCAAALVLFLLGAGFQYSLAVWLGAYTTLSRDAINGISFGMEGVWFLLAGFALSFLGRGYRPLENLTASAVFGVVTFFVLRALKPPSFSYDRFFASTGELVIWSLCAAAGSWLLSMWGASFGMLIGANGHVDVSLRYESGIARTHLRLNRRTAVVLSVMSGFEADLKHKILGTNSHALLLKFSSDFNEWRQVIPKVSAVPGVAGVSPFILNEVILSHGQTVTGAELKGIDPATVGG